MLFDKHLKSSIHQIAFLAGIWDTLYCLVLAALSLSLFHMHVYHLVPSLPDPLAHVTAVFTYFQFHLHL